MSEYPEHIDQIDDFYRNQLADHEITPPDGLWDKINLGISDTQTPESNTAGASLLSPKQKFMGLGVLAILIIVAILYFYSNKKNTAPLPKNSTPPVQPLQQKSDKALKPSINEAGEEIIISSPDKIKHQASQSVLSGKNHGKAMENADADNTADGPKEEVPAILNTTLQEEPQRDSIADVKTATKAPKEKVKFKDKYKKQYHDSTRKIFVPGK